MDSGVRNRKVVVQFPSHPDFVHVSLDMLAHNRTNSLHEGTKCRQKMLQEFLVTCENIWQIISRILVKISREVSDDLHKSLCGRICQMTCRIVCNIEMC